MKVYLSIFVLIVLVGIGGYLWQKPQIDCYYKTNFQVTHDATWMVEDGECVAQNTIKIDEPTDDEPRAKSFEECMIAGTLVEGSDPRRCISLHGREFTEGVVSVISFEECIAAGNPAMESHPQMCEHEGQVFTELIEGKTITEVRETYGLGLFPECEIFDSPALSKCPENFAPVCGEVSVECVTEPCNPVSQTFRNLCEACGVGQRLVAYQAGECSDPN